MKKYILRLAYILFLFYPLGPMVTTVRDLAWHIDFTKTIRFWAPSVWCSQFYHYVIANAKYYSLTAYPVLALTIFLIFSWLKKPTIIKAILLFIIFFALNPYLDPWYTLDLALTGQRPWIQPIY